MMTLSPLSRVIGQNLRRNVRSLILSAFGIAVGIAAFVFFWGLSAGVSRVVLHDIFPIDRVEVITPRTSLTGMTVAIDDTVVDKIAARPEVKAAYPKMKMVFPASGTGRLFGSGPIRIEVGGFCDGIDPSLVEGDPGTELFKDWEALEEGKRSPCDPQRRCPQDYYCAADGLCHHRVPVLVSRTLVEIYNGSFAPAHGMPRIGTMQEAALLSAARQLRFVITLGESALFGLTGNLRSPPRAVEAMLVGISNKAMPIGMTVPIGYLKRWNEAYAGPQTAKNYSSIVVDLEDRSQLGTFLPYVRSLGLDQEESQAERIALVITIVTALFLLIAFTIMFISAVNISHTFFMMVSERRREIGLMRAVGASRSDIWKIVLGEAAVIGVAAGAAGVVFAIGLARLIDVVSTRQLPDYPFKPQTYFSFSPELVLVALGFAVLFCVVGASLPARKAAAIHPAQALSG
jgi:putative ABC transport system permease protein